MECFTTKLPAEIRLKTYGYLLRFDAKPKLVSLAWRKAKSSTLGILRVKRQLHRKALQVLYAVNTISAGPNAFFTHVSHRARRGPQHGLNHNLIRKLYVSSLEPSNPCDNLIRTSENASLPTILLTHLPCVYCDT